MIECPECGREFGNRRQLAGHMKYHRPQSVMRSFRIPKGLWRRFEYICNSEGMTTCQGLRELLEVYISTHEMKMIKSPPSLLVPTVLNIRVGDGRKARLLMKLRPETDAEKLIVKFYTCRSCEISYTPEILPYERSCPRCKGPLEPHYEKLRLKF